MALQQPHQAGGYILSFCTFIQLAVRLTDHGISAQQKAPDVVFKVITVLITNILTRLNYHILTVFIISNFLFSCKNLDYAEQVSSYPETRIANNWTLKLPPDLRETGIKDVFYKKVFTLLNNRITLGVKTQLFSIDDGAKQFNSIAENVRQGKVNGPCMGSSEGYSKDYNFIDSAKMLSGVITDYEENGQWEVQFNVISAMTGNSLSLGFKKLSPEDVKLVHEIIKSLHDRK